MYVYIYIGIYIYVVIFYYYDYNLSCVIIYIYICICLPWPVFEQIFSKKGCASLCQKAGCESEDMLSKVSGAGFLSTDLAEQDSHLTKANRPFYSALGVPLFMNYGFTALPLTGSPLRCSCDKVCPLNFVTFNCGHHASCRPHGR